MDFDIRTDADGRPRAVNGLIQVVADEGARLFKRNAFKPFAVGRPRESWLVGELDGVRVYLRPVGATLEIELTREDRYPCPR